MRWVPILLAVTMAGTAGCAPTINQELRVGLGLSSVQRPADTAERWGDYTIEPADSTGYLYSDEMVALAVVPQSGSFSIAVENLTDHSVMLLWDRSAYVGPDGISSGVVPGTTTWAQMGQAPAPQVIPSRSTASVVALPTRNANTSTMSIRPFFAGSSCEDFTSQPIRLIFPFEIEGQVNEYTLHFDATQAEVVALRRQAYAQPAREVGRESCLQ